MSALTSLGQGGSISRQRTSAMSKGDVANNILYPGVDYSLPWAFGDGTAAAVNGAMEKCATAGGGTVLLPAVDIPDDATIDNKYPKVLLASVADGARYVNSGTGVYACRLIPTFAGTVLKHRTPYAAELGGAVNQYFGGGFKGISVKGNGVATRLLDIDTVSGGYYDLYLEDSVGPDCARLYCGRSSIDVLGPSDIQSMPMCRLFIRQLGSGAPRLADCVVFDNINTGNVSLNFNIFLDIQHYDGDALDIISGDNNHIWLRADNTGGTGKAAIMRGPTASHTVGADSNTFKYLVASPDGGIVAEGTDTGGVTAGVINVIESLDIGNGSPTPTAGTGSVWRTRTNFGGDANMAVGKLAVANNEANARAQRALMPSTRSLVVHNTAGDHIQLTNGTHSWNENIDGSNGNLRIVRAAGSGGIQLPLDAIPNFADDAAAASGGVGLWGVYRTGSALKIRTA